MVSPFKGLDNKQIALVYYRFLGYLKKLNKYIDTGMMPKEMMSPMGLITVLVPAQNGEVEEFQQSEFFKLACSIVKDLKPIVELIEETDADVKSLQEILS